MKRLLLFLAPVLLATAGPSTAQDLEPRAFSQVPVGMNFAVLATGYAEGGMIFDQATTLEDVTGEITSVTAGYLRTINFFGASAKVSALVPVMWGDWQGRYQGEFARASRRGFADPICELSVNFLGAPALKMSELRGFRQKWVVGASVRVTVPVGQYYPEKLLNLGTNRWAFRPRVGVSFKSGGLTLEAMGSVWLFTRNDDFFGGALLEQDALWAGQFNAVYQWPSGIWLGAAAGLARGGKAKTNGVASDTYRKSTRFAGVLSVPLARRHSLKFIYVNGLRTRVGADFDKISVAWSMRWGGER